MLATLIKTTGVDQLANHSIIVIVLAIFMFCAAFGWLADWVTRYVSFGAGPNALILFVSMITGLLTCNARFEHLRQLPASTIVFVGVGSALAGLMLLSFLRSRLVSA